MKRGRKPGMHTRGWPWCCPDCRIQFDYLCSRMRQGLPLSRDDQREKEVLQKLANDSRTRS